MKIRENLVDGGIHAASLGLGPIGEPLAKLIDREHDDAVKADVGQSGEEIAQLSL